MLCVVQRSQRKHNEPNQFKAFRRACFFYTRIHSIKLCSVVDSIFLLRQWMTTTMMMMMVSSNIVAHSLEISFIFFFHPISLCCFFVPFSRLSLSHCKCVCVSFSLVFLSLPLFHILLAKSNSFRFICSFIGSFIFDRFAFDVFFPLLLKWLVFSSFLCHFIRKGRALRMYHKHVIVHCVYTNTNL